MSDLYINCLSNSGGITGLGPILDPLPRFTDFKESKIPALVLPEKYDFTAGFLLMSNLPWELIQLEPREKVHISLRRHKPEEPRCLLIGIHPLDAHLTGTHIWVEPYEPTPI